MMQTLAMKLKKARERAKLSMAEVARRSSKAGGADYRRIITQSYLSKLESGQETNPSFLKIKTFCAIYKIKPGSLF